MGRRQPAETHVGGAGESCTASAPRRSTNIASTLRKTRPSNAASRRSTCDQPSVEDTNFHPARALRERYEVHHGVRHQRFGAGGGGSGCLSNRYISDRFLPDKGPLTWWTEGSSETAHRNRFHAV